MGTGAVKISNITFLLTGLLIVTCGDLIVKDTDENLNVADIEVALQKINEVYPLLQYKGIDWDSLYDIYSLQAENARGDEIYQVLHDLLGELKDPHVYYRADGGGAVMPYLGRRILRDKDTYCPYVVRSYFNSQLRSSRMGKVDYGILPGNIGYIYISTFSGEGIMDDFDEVMDHVRDTDGLILDIRNNNGGVNDNLRPVISRFLDSPLPFPLLFTKGEVPYYGEDWAPILPNSRYASYSNDVVVLINGASISAAELFPEIMGQLPHVTLMGDTTNGAVCNDIAEDKGGEYFLPSGKFINISTTYIVRFDGVIAETNGIPPDIRIPQTVDDIRKGTDRQLESAMELLN